MDAIEVEARFDQQGKITPLRFTWRGQTYPVESTGRQWQEQDEAHILVIVAGDRVLELVFNAGQVRWYLKAIGGRRSLA